MKQFLLALLIFFCVSSNAQTDTTIIPKGGIPIVPMLFLTDSTFSIGQQVGKISSDTTLDSYGEIYVYSKKGNRIFEYGFIIPKEIINSWGTNNKTIDDFIFNKFPQFKRKSMQYRYYIKHR